MNYYCFYYTFILQNYLNNFINNFINFLVGNYSENEFKIFRLQYGLYRQKSSYMLRLSIPYGILNFDQFFLISYISYIYDKKYFHFTTRTNIQFNWIKLFYIFEIFKKTFLFFINSIQSSGNCVRNITSNINKFLNPTPWGEIIRQWFTFNSEFLFLPRKFKISILSCKKDYIIFKCHDLGIYIKKNFFNNLIINFLIGGGLGRTPVIGFYILKNIHWNKILNYFDKIVRIYNIYGFRNNIYKSRLKILIKSLPHFNYLSFIYKEFNYSNKHIYFFNEKNINYFFCLKKNNLKNYFLKKKIIYNNFFLCWLKNNIFNNFLFIPIKNNNTPSGDVNYLQIKIIYYFLNKTFYIFIFNRQNLLLDCSYFNIYLIYLKLKKYFLNIYNSFLITDSICCPGQDYCVLANAKSIYLLNIIKYMFLDFNTIFKLGKISLNISGCINSCGHHHVSNLGFLGVNKSGENYYQIYLGGNYNNFCSLKFSKAFLPSVSNFKIFYFFLKILKKFFLFNIYSNFRY
ncbi:nitrite/sulfite reductase [Candidatus Nasuia deltocephalinicola]|nr:nitrite/sulfite reductase [Candidatus Nasuia deltocephalinicola]